MLTQALFFAIALYMYIKKVRKSNPKSNKVFEYLHLVENVRTKKGPRQRLILNLGRLDIAVEQYKDLANCIEGLLTGQRSMFSSAPAIEKLAREAVEKITEKQAKQQPVAGLGNSDPADFKLVNITSMDASRVRSLGPEYVCHCQWNELGFNEIFLQNGIAAGTLPLLEPGLPLHPSRPKEKADCPDPSIAFQNQDSF
jgi:hypothetical protein